MKEIKCENKVELLDFGIKVNPYLTYGQIQQIVNAVIKFDTWAERQQNIDMLVLYHATDIGKEEIESYTHDEWLQSGIIDAVKNNIKNYSKIKEAIEYTESTKRALAQIIKRLPEMVGPLEKVMKEWETKQEMILN